MPPEALDDPPVYTNKLDCFSFGVLDIQILTRQFPEPSQRFKTIEISDPRVPDGTVKVPVAEVERRQSHINLVNPAHPLLPVALDCLKNRERERPSAQELCHRLATLKEAPQYGESVQQAQRVTTDGENVEIRELQADARESQRQLQEKDRTIATKERQLQEKDHAITTKERQLQEKDRTMEMQLQEKDRTITTRERQLQQLSQQLEENEQVTADFQHKHMESEKIIADLRETLAAKDQQIRELQQQICDQPTAKLQDRGQSARKGPLHLHWSKCGNAPHKMCRPSSVVDGNMAYFHHYKSKDVYSYNSEKQTWSSLPHCPYEYFCLAVVNGLLTAIGGGGVQTPTNKLISLTGERKWVEHFPPMPTKRSGPQAVCTGKSLVVAGGGNMKSSYLNTVEVMDTETLQWSTASSLPFALRYASATLCQDHIYLLGYDSQKDSQVRFVLACPMADLLQSCQSQSLGARLMKALTLQAVWHRVGDLPVRNSSCATLCGQLLAVGGCDNSFENRTTAIHQYNPATNSWEVISHMPTARNDTLVAVLPDNKLMVVGGYIDSGETDEVAIATLQE